MNQETFVTIQLQKIFSLFNCPDSEFTWKLFQRYFRELILESWSLLINEIDQEFINKEKNSAFDARIVEKRKLLYDSLDKFIPKIENDIASTFIHIFKIVKGTYENDIMKGFKDMAIPLLQFKAGHFFLCQLGFRPYSLLSESGARITSKKFKKTNFIKDPELKYQQKTFANRFTLLSITRKLDDIFNDICMKVNQILGNKTFLKLFLRRTLSGCEFGFCLNLDIESNNPKFDSENPYCIIDRDPLLVLTIFVRSLVPVMAFILIALAIYITNIGYKISKWFVFPTNVKEIAKKTLSVIVDAVTSNVANVIYDMVLKYLEEILDDNIEILKSNDEGNAQVIITLKNLFKSKTAKIITNKLSDYLGSLFTINSDFESLVNNFVNPFQLMKISAYLMLIIASFVMNFRYKKKAIEDYETVSKQYNDNCNEFELEKLLNQEDESFDDFNNLKPMNPIQLQFLDQINQSNRDKSKDYLYKMAFCKLVNKAVDLSDFLIDPNQSINDEITNIIKCVFTTRKSNCLRIEFSSSRRVFFHHLTLLATNSFPSIIPLIGYKVQKNKQYLFVDYKEKGTLDSLINEKRESISLTNKLIISYGIARAMLHLHDNKIVHRNLKPSSVHLDSNLHPFLSDFQLAMQTQTPILYYLKQNTIEYMAPEFVDDYRSNQKSFKIDVYSFAILLFNLITEQIPFNSYSSKIDLINAIKKGEHPTFPRNFSNKFSYWKELITKCWDPNPEKRPDFSSICDYLEEIASKSEGIDRKIFQNYKEENFGCDELVLTAE